MVNILSKLTGYDKGHYTACPMENTYLLDVETLRPVHPRDIVETQAYMHDLLFVVKPAEPVKKPPPQAAPEIELLEA